VRKASKPIHATTYYFTERYPDLINMRGSVDTVKQAPVDALEEIWKEIPESLLESLDTSMPRRVAAVIKADR